MMIVGGTNDLGLSYEAVIMDKIILKNFMNLVTENNRDSLFV